MRRYRSGGRLTGVREADFNTRASGLSGFAWFDFHVASPLVVA